jgi:hypothetical protein
MERSSESRLRAEWYALFTFIAVTLLILAEFALAMNARSPTTSFTSILLLLLLVGIWSGVHFMAAAWSVVGLGPIWCRWPAALAAAAAHHGLMLQAPMFPDNKWRLAGMLLLLLPSLLLAAQFPLAIVAAWRNWRIVPLEDVGRPLPKFQFRIAGIMILMLILAATLCLAQFALRIDAGNGRPRWEGLVTGCAAISLHAVVFGIPCLWAVLAPGRAAVRTACVAAAIAFCTGFVPLSLLVLAEWLSSAPIGPPSNADWLYITLALVLPLLGILGSLIGGCLLIRLLGFRLVSGAATSPSLPERL